MDEEIARHLRACRAAGFAANTIDDRQKLLLRMDRELPNGLVEATTGELLDWFGRPELRWSGKTRRTYWSHGRGFFVERVESGALDYDPFACMRPPRVGRHLPRVATEAQINHALARLRGPHRLAVVLALGTGMRAGEAAIIERSDFADGRVRILGKGDKERMVPVPADVWGHIADLSDGRLIRNQYGHLVDGDHLSHMVAAALDRAGVPGVTLHYFRGAYATRLRRAGVDTAVIARLLGHSTVATTEHYLQIEDADLDLAVRKLPPLPLVVRSEPADDRLGPTAA